MKAISKINNTLAKIEGAVMVFWFAIVLAVMTGILDKVVYPND